MGFEVVFKRKRSISNEYLIIFITIIIIVIEYYYHNIVGLNFITVFIFLTLNLACIGIIGEFLLNSATKLSNKINIPPFILGLVLIPMFSSFPEDLITIITNIRDASLGEVVISQILGNNLFELLIVFGLAGVLTCQLSQKCVSIEKKDKTLFLRNGIMLLIGSFLVFVLIFFDRNLSFADGIILIIFYCIFIIMVYFSYKSGIKEMEKIPEELPSKEKIRGIREFSLVIIFIILVLFLGSFFVDDVLFLVSKSPDFEKFSFLYIGIAIAIPELVLTIIGFLRKKEDLVIGLVIGGALWDSIVSIAIQGFTNPVYNISSLVITFFLLTSIVGIAMALLYIRTQWRLRTWEALILLLTYIVIVIVVIFLI